MYSFLPHVNGNRPDHGFSRLQGSYWAYRNASASRWAAGVSKDKMSDETDGMQGALASEGTSGESFM